MSHYEMRLDRDRRAIGDLGVEVKLRNIHSDPEAHAALVAARGRGSVPVLHVEDGDVWMPESGDIVRYLYERFGEGKRPPLSARVNPQLLLMAAVGLVVLWSALSG